MSWSSDFFLLGKWTPFGFLHFLCANYFQTSQLRLRLNSRQRGTGRVTTWVRPETKCTSCPCVVTLQFASPGTSVGIWVSCFLTRNLFPRLLIESNVFLLMPEDLGCLYLFLLWLTGYFILHSLINFHMLGVFQTSFFYWFQIFTLHGQRTCLDLLRLFL